MGKTKIIVIGAGAAGLMAACAASDAGADVTIFEHNEKAGKKIFITGKGRCNFTNACAAGDFFQNVPRNPKFLYSALYDFDSQDMIRFLEENGCPTKVERGRRAFPLSDHAFDVTDALVRHCRKNGVKIVFHCGVKEILASESVQGVVLDDGRRISCGRVILATGGLSYPSTGSTGDGLRFAQSLGLQLTETAPSLVPLVTKETWPLQLQGLSLKNVGVRILPREISEEKDTACAPEAGAAGRKKTGAARRQRPVYEGFGEMLFTHFGLSGPLILTASSLCDFHKYPEGFILHLDLKPALSGDQLVNRLKREFLEAPDRELSNALRPLFPERLALEIARIFAACQENGSVKVRASAEGGEFRKARTLNVREIEELAALIRDLPITLTGTRGYAEAIVTRGGISVREFNPSTMESRKIKGLFAAGEVLDLDAFTGGYNLQIAWSTGHLAGISAAALEEE